MEKLLNSYDKEYMRMAMLKHEETFKQQVYELHRLYRIQKLLMKNMTMRQNQELHNSSNNNNNGMINLRSQNATGIKLEHEYIAELNRNIQELEVIDESKIELTLGPPSSISRRRKKPESTALNSDYSGPTSFSSSSTGSSQIKRTSFRVCEKSRQFRIPDDKTSTEIEGQVPKKQQQQDERLKHPPWLLQVLNLNTT